LACDANVPSGAEARIALPAGVFVLGRIARCADGVLAVAFRQDDATSADVDRALDAIKSMTRSAAA
jgi:hypothetical protein